MYMDFIANTPTDANATACDSVVAHLRANTTFVDQPTTKECLYVTSKVKEIFSTNLGTIGWVDNNGCLSNDGIFTLRGGEQKRGDEVKLYDEVLVNLKGNFEPIFLFRHAATVSRELKPFIRLSLDNGKTVDATPNHFTDTLVLFKDVAVGNKISGATVTHVEEVLNSGNLSPKTPSGTIVVNGVVVSCYAFDERFAMFINPSTFVALSKAGVWVLSWFPSTVTVALYGLYEKGLDMH
ncbi:hypothetical protein ScalyP_jg2218 [Parmales sp. scaly parma]|nr:hypothetical protein ScalyP_jg2218 [Parmales sp. scaly parma]